MNLHTCMYLAVTKCVCVCAVGGGKEGREGGRRGGGGREKGKERRWGRGNKGRERRETGLTSCEVCRSLLSDLE